MDPACAGGGDTRGMWRSSWTSGEVPQKLDALVTLPDVARKTANVVVGSVWGSARGGVVDTHVT